jgi:hypothetical protein
MRLPWVCLVGVWMGCDGSSSSNAIDAAPAIDAMRDARLVDAATICAPLARFSPPGLVTGIATNTMNELDPHLTSDELAIYLSSGPTSGGLQLYAAHRRAVTDRFDDPNLLPVVNNKLLDQDPTVSGDGRELWFASERGPSFTVHLYSATRATTFDDFSTPVLDPNVNSTDAQDYTPFLTADGQQLWFTSTRLVSTQDQTHLPNIWNVTREGRSFTTPRMEAAFASTAQIQYSNPVLSADRLTIYVARTDVAMSTASIWRSHRDTIYAPFPPPAAVDELNTGNGSRTPGWLSADNCRLYFSIIPPFLGFVDSNVAMATREP